VGGNSSLNLELKDPWKAIGHLPRKIKFSIQNSIFLRFAGNCQFVDKSTGEKNQPKKLP